MATRGDPPWQAPPTRGPWRPAPWMVGMAGALAVLLVAAVVLAVSLTRQAGRTPGTLPGGVPGAGTAAVSPPPSPTVRDVLIPSPLVAPALAQAAAADLPAVTVPLRPGASGPDVAAFQQHLTSLSYMAGPASSSYGTALTFAVSAFQKVAGLPRTGVIDAATRDAMTTAQRPTPAYAAPRRHIEVDIAHQVLYEVDGGQVTATVSVSTGTDKKFVEKGTTHVAVTPNGVFTVLWKHDGWWTSPLGQLYRPAFIDDKLGIAIHGYPNVPNQPASHGCIRVPMVFADWMYTSGTPQGTTVFVYGGPDGPNP